jgi:tRNA1(Val) A37 N6-methylase TrmN6
MSLEKAMQIYSQHEWSDILLKYPKPDDIIKEKIWEKTRELDLKKQLTLNEAKEDFQLLKSLDTRSLIKNGEIFSRYEYKWDIGNTYIDSCNVGNKSSNYFHQTNRWKCDSINSPSPERNWNEKKFFFTLLNSLWSLKVKNVSLDTLRTCMSMRKYIASQFRPSAAKCLYDHFRAKNILDFSSGWGDRLTAALATASVKQYIGIDPNDALFDGYKQQINYFNSGKNVQMITAPAEDVFQHSLITKKDIEPDLIFTSPPYFIVERYSRNDTQSWVRYKKLDKWLENFLFPVVSGCLSILKPNGILAINISDVYCNHTINHICDPMNDFIKNTGLVKKLDNINYRMAKRKNSKSNKQGIFVEPIWIWRKHEI